MASDHDESAAAILAAIGPVVEPHGFQRSGVDAARGSGGPFVEATWVKRADGHAERTLSVWARYDRLSVSYSVGIHSLEHGQYMREMLGPSGSHRFPTFGDDLQSGLTALIEDLHEFGGDFLSGPGDEFSRCATNATATAQMSGFQRLRRAERELRDDE